ncbi:MAG: large conductance mechanosensitive channel protein MscL [Ruminococcaceae bacterium]|nr:large conductance mechanosensitive channel protein MscL [Oscillospiraceae bacterium]
MKKFFSDFKAFITKGNVVDMAIGVVVGGAFKDIVNALVANIITPLIGLMLGGTDLSDHKYVLQEEVVEIVDGVETVTTPENAVLWGSFLQTVIDFLIIALTIFVVIKVAMAVHNKAEAAAKRLRKQEEEAAVEEAPAEPEISSTDKLLIEIRDLLKKDDKAE